MGFFFQFLIILNVFFPLHLNTYVMGYGHYKFVLFFQCVDQLQTSESDVYRRQNLMSKVDPRTERVNIGSFLMLL